MKKSWWRGLQVKIIAWSFIPTVIILSAVALFTFYSYQRVIGDLAIKQDREIVGQKGYQIFQAYTSLVNPILLATLGDIDKLHEGSLEARAQNILDKAPGLDVIDGGIYFLNEQGIVFKTSPEIPEMIGQDWSDTPHFRSLKAQWNSATFTDLIPIGTSGKQVVCSGLAMPDQNLVTIGAAYFCLQVYPVSQNAYYQRLNSINLGQNILLLDRNNHVIYSNDPLVIGKDLSHESYIQQLSNSANKSGRYRIDSKQMVISYVPLSSTVNDALGWTILGEQSWDEIMQPTLAYRQLLLILLVLGVIVPVLVTGYGVRHITEPIQKLIHATAQVTAGKFRNKIEVNTGDEIEILADQFNTMSAKLDDSYSSLEKKVADRTKELATLNSIISVASRSLNIPEIMEDALNMTVEQMGFDAGAALRIEPDQPSKTLISYRDIEPAVVMEYSRKYLRTNPDQSTDESLRVNTFEIEIPQDDQQSLSPEKSGFHLLVTVPISTKGRILGYFLLARHTNNLLSQEGLTLLNTVGQQIGVAVENAQLYEKAEQAAIAAERNRLARELHDAVTQTLFSASLIADVTPRIWKRDPEEGMHNLEELRQLTRGALAEMRTMLLEMRPDSLERPDLKTLITQLTDAFIGRVRVPVSLDIHGDCILPREVKIVFYRVAQEALNNIAKHSGARQVEVQLNCEDARCNMTIKDDGLGFNVENIAPGHMGIAIMRERASSVGASLKIESQPGLGATVELDWHPTRKD